MKPYYNILSLKTGIPIILLRYINPPRLCNGARLFINKLLLNVIEAIILNGISKGEDVLIPRIPTDIPFDFKRLHFPIRLAFSMAINKAECQSFKVCGINLKNPWFSHFREWDSRKAYLFLLKVKNQKYCIY